LEWRSFNQDPSENLNGLIRAQFVAAYKTAIINNFSHGDLRGTNCEYDNLQLLTDMKEFLNGSEEQVEEEFPEDGKIILF